MNFRQLQVFNAVMRTATVTEAARLLNMSQPAVSKALKLMQEDLDIELFQRVRGRLFPTPEATTLYSTVERIFDDVSMLRHQAAELREGHSGQLKIAAIPTLAGSLLPQAVAIFRSRRPDVQIEIRAMSSAQVVQAMVQQKIDLGLVYAPFEDVGTQAKHLPQHDLVCLVPRHHPLAGARRVTPRELRDEAIISFPDDSPVYGMLQRVFEAAGAVYRPSMVANHTLTACALVAAGAGVALVDPFLCWIGAFPGLAIRPFRPRIGLRPRVLLSRNRPVSRLANYMADVMREAALSFGAAPAASAGSSTPHGKA